MNERIKELAEQSYKEVIETNDYNGSAYTVLEFDQEKFAELLLMECITICEELGDKGMDGHYCADKINKTFRS